MTTLDQTLDAYIECALWSSLDLSQADESGNNPPLDERLDVSDVQGSVLEQMQEDVTDFIEANADAINVYLEGLGYGPEQVGHDFWLTREGHGAGFWDRYYGADKQLLAACKDLADAARAYGTFDAIHEL